MKFIDLTGRKFGRLKVLKKSNSQYPFHWICLCECGKKTEVRGGNLRSGSIKSCGCYRLENSKKKGRMTDSGIESVRRANTIHGWRSRKEYSAYRGAVERCRNRKDKSWENYGGRGIQFRFHSFKEFIDHIGPKPEPNRIYMLDRINNDGHYEPGNVRWATKSESSKNRRVTGKLQESRRQNLSLARAKRWKKSEA